MDIHLIRHGEVDNPADVVYADIPGFGLSARGREQAAAAGMYLKRSPLSRIVSSPLDRARETAELIASATGAPISFDERLTEWGLAVRWRGAVWPRLPVVFPGELEAYLRDPRHLPFSPESLEAVAARVSAAVSDWCRNGEERDVAFVSHQDPIHVAHLHLLRSDFEDFHADKPRHCTVTSLRATNGNWREESRWHPDQ